MSKPRCLAPQTNYPEFHCGSPAVWTLVYSVPPKEVGTPRRRRIYDACAQHLHKVCRRAADQGADDLAVVLIED